MNLASGWKKKLDPATTHVQFSFAAGNTAKEPY
jgi:hypothetical protein